MRASWLSLLLVSPTLALAAQSACDWPSPQGDNAASEVWSGWALEDHDRLSPEAVAELERLDAEWAAGIERVDAEWEVREAQAKPHLDSYMSAMSQARAEHARALAVRGDARSLLAAAVLMQRYDIGGDTWGAEALGYLAMAQRRGGEDPLVWWLTAVMCYAESPICDRDAALAKLATLDPDNGAVWALRLRQANAVDDQPATESHLQRLFASARYDDYHGALRVMFYEAYRDMAVPPQAADSLAGIASAYGAPHEGTLGAQDLALAEGLTVLMIIATEHRGSIYSACDADNVEADAVRRDACIHVFERMAEGSEHLIGKQIAYGQLIRLHEQGGAAQKHWLNAERRLKWLTAKSGDVAMMDGIESGLLRDMFAHGEIAAIQRLLEAHGIAVEPPADWTAESPAQLYGETPIQGEQTVPDGGL